MTKINLYLGNLLAWLLLAGCATPTGVGEHFGEKGFPLPRIQCNPRHHICYRTAKPIVIDGRLTDGAWQKAPWTKPFVDIEGPAKPAPTYKTRAKMLWDEKYLYIGVNLEEPHVWANLIRRDSVIFKDNDFEVFIDPDGDTHNYYELELNALNTQWDLILQKPYRDGGPAINAWDIQGLKTAVHIDGTLNNHRDRDRGWSIEIALPWEVLGQCTTKKSPPINGDQWRVNFSRVEWNTEIKNGSCLKMVDSSTGKLLPENNWIWSAQGLIAMHYPEMWGIVQFSDNLVGTTKASFRPDPDFAAKWYLRQIYYSQRNYHERRGRFFAKPGDYDQDFPTAPPGCKSPAIHLSPSGFELILDRPTGALHINQFGRLWRRNQ